MHECVPDWTVQHGWGTILYAVPERNFLIREWVKQLYNGMHCYTGQVLVP